MIWAAAMGPTRIHLLGARPALAQLARAPYGNPISRLKDKLLEIGASSVGLDKSAERSRRLPIVDESRSEVIGRLEEKLCKKVTLVLG